MASPDAARRHAGERHGAGHLTTYLLLTALAIAYIFPFIVQVANSFKSDVEATNSGLTLWSANWTTAAYVTLFQNSDFALWTLNSVIVTVLITSGRVFFVCLAGYALARLRFPGRQLVYVMLLGVMSVPAVVLLIPKFLVIKSLGIYDSYPGMVLPLLVDAAGVFIMRNFFESIPVAVEEAARIDGAGTFRTFWSVVLPMSRPALMTIIILSFQGSWNELNHFIISTQSPALVTLTRGVAGLAGGGLSSGNQYPITLGAAAVMTIPVAIIFFVFQKRIMNASGGAVKE